MTTGEPGGAITGGRVVDLLDPTAELVRGAFPYAGCEAELPDDAPVPSVRVHRSLSATELRLRMDLLLGDELTARDELLVGRLPIDRELAQPHARRHPAPREVITVRWGELGAGDLATASTAGDAVCTLPVEGATWVDIEDLVRRARSCRYVVIEHVPPDTTSAAALVLHLTAAGIVCSADAAVADRLTLLSPELRSSIRSGPHHGLDDDLSLAARAADQRRAAWVGHDLELRWDGTGERWEPRLRPVRTPPVSAVLVSRRPWLVPAALAMVAAQRDVDLEVVVALHGDGDPAAVTEQMRQLSLSGTALAVPAHVPFGAVVNAAVDRATAPLVLKWDDDDLYGPRHVQDLLVARRQTGAGIVGKALEFVYLEESDETLWRLPARAESPYLALAGGTLLLDRALLDEIGGFPGISRAIDHHLRLRARALGATVFRTHGFGFVLRRHDAGHTWDATSARFTAKAVARFPGIPAVIGLGGVDHEPVSAPAARRGADDVSGT